MIHSMFIQEDLWLNLTLESPPLQLTISLEKVKKVKTWRRRMEGWRVMILREFLWPGPYTKQYTVLIKYKVTLSCLTIGFNPDDCDDQSRRHGLQEHVCL